MAQTTHYAWSLAAAAVGWKNDTGTGYEEESAHNKAKDPSEESDDPHLPMTQVCTSNHLACMWKTCHTPLPHITMAELVSHSFAM